MLVLEKYMLCVLAVIIRLFIQKPPALGSWNLMEHLHLNFIAMSFYMHEVNNIKNTRPEIDYE